MIMKENSTMMTYYLRDFTWIVTAKITYGDSRYGDSNFHNWFSHLTVFDPTRHNLVKSPTTLGFKMLTNLAKRPEILIK